MRITPALGTSSPAISRSVVVLPQPEGPTRTSSSPSATLRHRSWTARTPLGYVLPTRSRATSAIDAKVTEVAASCQVGEDVEAGHSGIETASPPARLAR